MKIKQIIEGIESNQGVAEGSLNEFAPSEDNRRIPEHYILEKDRYNLRSKWKKSYDPEGGGVLLFTTKEEALQAVDKFNRLDKNREFKYGGTQMSDIDEQGVAEGKEDKIKQLRQDHATAVHWSKNDTNPHKREAARQKAEKIKRHLETQYKQGVAEGQEVDVNVIVGKLYDMIDHAENQIKNADTDNQAKYATILRDRAQKALVMIKQGGHTSDTASAAYKYFLTGQQNKLEEVSLGDYRRKASLSKAGAQIDKVFGSPENREKADSIIAKRDRGLDRADARGRANAEKLKQKAEQDRIASLRSAKDRLDDIKAELAELEAKFDSYYEYSDDHGEWTRQRELHQKIMAMKKHIADIEALDEADGNFSQPATMMNASPQAKAQAQSIVQQQADKNVISQAKFAGVAPEMEESAEPDPLENVLYDVFFNGKYFGKKRGHENTMQMIKLLAKQPPYPKGSMKRAEDQQAKETLEETLSEGEPGDLEHQLNKKEYNDDKIAGRYDPDEFDAMINRVKELAGRGPLVTIRGDDGKTRNVPKKDLNK